MRRFVISVVIALLGGLLLAPATATAGPGPDGYSGVWRAIQCAQWESDGPFDLHCEIWGDGSQLQLIIGPGDQPRMVFMDSYSAYCDVDLAAPTAHRIARGVGQYDEYGMLWFDVTSGGCGSVPIAGYSEGAFYWDPGSDTLWSHDPEGDGYGLHWWRIGG